MKRFNSDFFSHMFSRIGLTFTLLFIVCIFVFACASALYIPNESQSKSKDNLQEMKEGRALYINKCGGCHSLFVPEKYSPIDWKNWVDKMETKAKVTPKEKELILIYLTKGQ